jgi:hypothetical protein
MHLQNLANPALLARPWACAYNQHGPEQKKDKATLGTATNPQSGAKTQWSDTMRPSIDPLHSNPSIFPPQTPFAGS